MRSLDLQTLSVGTKKKIRDAVGVRNTKQIIQLARENGVDIGIRKDVQERRAFQYFGEIQNGIIERENERIRFMRSLDTRRRDANKLKKSVIATITTNLNDAYDAIKRSFIRRLSINAIFIADGNIIRNMNYDFRNVGDNPFSFYWAMIKHDLMPETDTDIFTHYPNGKLFITVGTEPVRSEVIQTAFFDGKINCVLKSIIEFGEEKVKTVKSNKNYITFVNKAKELEKKYHDIGVNSQAINDICNILQVDIHVDLPFQQDYIVCKTNKKPLRTYRFKN